MCPRKAGRGDRRILERLLNNQKSYTDVAGCSKVRLGNAPGAWMGLRKAARGGNRLLVRLPIDRKSFIAVSGCTGGDRRILERLLNNQKSYTDVAGRSKVPLGSSLKDFRSIGSLS